MRMSAIQERPNVDKLTKKIKIPFLRSEFQRDVWESVGDVFSSGYVGSGPKVQDFEARLAEYLGVSNVILTSSCTAALTLSYLECGISRGALVLSTPVTCAATNIPLLHLGARIVWLDVDPLSGNVTRETLV